MCWLVHDKNFTTQHSWTLRPQIMRPIQGANNWPFITKVLGAKKVQIWTDFEVIVNYVLGEYTRKEDKLQKNL